VLFNRKSGISLHPVSPRDGIEAHPHRQADEENKMETKLFKVISQSCPIALTSQKGNGEQLTKCTIELHELGGKFGDQFVATMLGTVAENRYAAGDIVAARLRCRTHEHNGNSFQDVVVQEIVKMNNDF